MVELATADADARLTAAPRRGPRRLLRGARPRPPGPPVHDRAGGPAATATTPRSSSRTASSAPTAPSPRYPPARIRELRLRGWLTTILLNAGRNRARVRRVPTTELAFEPGAEPADDPLTRRDDRETWARLLAGLSPAQRTAVVLRHVDGLSYAEIAEATGRPEGTVKAHVHRGLAALRTALLAAERREREEIPA